MGDKLVARFSDFAKEECGLDGEKMQISEIFNKEVIVTGYRLLQSRCSNLKDKECLQLQFELDGKTYITFTNSVVLIRQVKEYCEHMPFATSIKKKGSYYTFT